MGVFDDELTLPGVITEILPVTMHSTTGAEFGSTESVTIIGTAFNGPVGQPIAIGSPEQAIYIFGDSFDLEKKREATLVPEIQDAYDRGCRTIYGVRVGGKEMYKDFDLAIETNLRLRVSGYYPHNKNKDCFMTFTATQGSDAAFDGQEGVIRIYKPADRTTIVEKRSGVVDSMDSVLVTEINLFSMGFEKNSRLCDVLDVMNTMATNNVLKFTLVDKDGIQRTNSDKEVQSIPVGALFPGIYTICREEKGANVKLITDIQVKRSDVVKLYPKCEEVVWKELVANTDPAQPYPIGANNFSKLSSILGPSVGVIDSYKFLEVAGMIDSIAIKNDEDYEEVELDGFDLYQRLGSGFLRTAVIEELGNGKFKVKSAPDGDEKRVMPIEDGIYSTLRMHNTDYTVLAAATCETDMSGKLPKKNAFKKAVQNAIQLFDEEGNEVAVASAKFDTADVNSTAVRYKIAIEQLEDDLELDNIMEELSDEKFRLLPIIPEVPEANKKFEGLEDGLLVFCPIDRKLYRLVDKKFVEADPEVISGVNVVINNIGRLGMDAVEENGNVSAIMAVMEDGESVPLSMSVDCREVFILDGKEYVKKDLVELSNELGKEFITVMSGAKALVFRIKGDELVPFCSLKDIAGNVFADEDFMLVCAEEDSPAFENNVVCIHIAGVELDVDSVEGFLARLNEHEAIEGRFIFEIADSNLAVADMLAIAGEGTNKEEGFVYDTDLHIPYTTTDNFARHLAQHCFYTSLMNYPTHGVIGCDKLTGITLSTVAERVDAVTGLKLDMYAKKANGNNIYTYDNLPYPIGRCVSIVFAQYPVNTGNGYNYISSGASGYAGMLSTLDADVSSTNQTVNLNKSSLMFGLSNYQLTRLNSVGIVCFRQVGEVIKVVDGITQDTADSPYRRLSTTKVINATAKLLRDAILPFIGRTRSDTTMNSMETAIKSALNSITGVLINKYNYEIVTDAENEYLGVVRIKYSIVPAYEIRQVINEIEIS